MTEEDVPSVASSSRSTLAPPVVVNPGASQDWPSRPVGDNFFAKALAKALANGHSITEAPRTNGDVADQGAAELSAWGAEDPLAVDESGADAEDGEEGWDIDVEVPETADEQQDEAEVEDAVPEDNMSPGITENEIWVRNSPLAADHVAAGSFETAMQVSLYSLPMSFSSFFKIETELIIPLLFFQLLNRQVGAVNFAPLKPLFLSVYRSSHVYIQANPSLPPIQLHIRRNPTAAPATSNVFPVVSCSLQNIVSNELQDAYAFVKKAKFNEALALFRTIIQSMLLVVVSTDAQAQEVSLVASPSFSSFV